MNSQISVQNLSKTFLVPHQKRTTLKESFVEFWRPKIYEKFAALTDVNFSIQPGEFLGIVGANGSGKSTLLKILAGIYQPGSGQVKVNGRIAPLLELGVGFQQELSARENIFINGTLLGLTPRYLRSILPKIVEFAEIGHFLDLKVKNFSSGMRQRLAFAIAAHLDADIYICDEVLAVGDESFQQKCLNTFAAWQAQGKTIILVTHNASQIEQLCTRAIYLEKGKIKANGLPEQVIQAYHADLNHTPAPSNDSAAIFNPINAQNSEFANSPLRLTGLQMFNSEGQLTTSFGTGEPITLRIHYQANQIVENPVFGLGIHLQQGDQALHISGPNTKTSNFSIEEIYPGQGFLECHFEQSNLLAGEYLVTLSCFDYSCQNPFDYLDKRFCFTIVKNRDNQYGLIDLSVKWSQP